MECVIKETIRYAWGVSTLGQFLVAASEQGVVALEFGSENGSLVHELESRFPNADVVMDASVLARVVEKTTTLIEQPASVTSLVADLRGSNFERRVWGALQSIPAGESSTYGELASRLGMPGNAQDIAAACDANTIAVIVPCHRVVKNDGTIANYRWGITRKLVLLVRERVGDCV
jgi:AraC family transcriptional regulator of adaptative response/methylated-DNA-[protein]-cysteine methyltransferase